jgi:hypothetical protein
LFEICREKVIGVASSHISLIHLNNSGLTFAEKRVNDGASIRVSLIHLKNGHFGPRGHRVAIEQHIANILLLNTSKCRAY